MKESSVCIIGQPKIDENIKSEIKSHLVEEISKLIMQGYDTFFVGHRIGFERIAFETLINMKKVISHIQIKAYEFTSVAPRGQEKEEELHFLELVKSADIKMPRPRPRKYNVAAIYREMIQETSLCLCYITPDNDDSAIKYTVPYITEEGQKSINLVDVIATYNKNISNTQSDACKAEAYNFECDYSETKPTSSENEDKINDYFDKLGIELLEDPFNSSPKMVVPKDKETFYNLLELLKAYAILHHGKMTATVDCEQWFAKFVLILPFVEFTSIEELKLLSYIGERTHNFSVSSTADGKVRMYIKINYFENI